MPFKYAAVSLCLIATPVFSQECSYDSDGNRYSCASPGATHFAAPPGRWHLFTQSKGGTISLLQGLTKSTCEFAMNRALGRPATDEEREVVRRSSETEQQRAKEFCALPKEQKEKSMNGSGIMCSPNGDASSWATGFGYSHPSDILRAECFQ